MIKPKEFKKLIDLTYEAHQEKCTRKEFRQEGKVPFVVHPLWCALMLLNDTRIPFEERELGYQVLLLHDFLEDTSQKIPDYINPKVVNLVKEMTHQFWEEEKAIDEKSDFVKLLKLCDKLASLYDENIRPDPKRRREWKKLIERLLSAVQKKYGNIRIVTMAKALLEETDW